MLRVLALVFLSLVVAMFGVFLLVATQEGSFLDLMFEAVSATGTTGLSRGTTTRLDDFGRGVLVVIMFLGRIGPLALGLMLARPEYYGSGKGGSAISGAGKASSAPSRRSAPYDS